MNPLLSAIEKKLAALPTPVRLILQDGTRLGSPNAGVTFAVSDAKVLAHLATGDIGNIGED